MVEIESSTLFRGENINWQYCKEHATFAHKEACEFIIHIGDDYDDWNRKIEEMKDYGCTTEFVRAYEDAARMGAVRVLFYA